jgi:bifunctional DNA-binding transcriptional regulator/antitoxin component of YhaV-PrlF toxin-antitoxin module
MLYFMNEKVQKPRRRGATRLSAKHQATIPVAALREAGIRAGDVLRVRVLGPGQIVLERADDAVEQFAGSLTGAFEPGYLDRLRDEW